MDAIPELEKQYPIYYSEAFKARSFISASYKIESKVKDLLEILEEAKSGGHKNSRKKLIFLAWRCII